MPNINEAQPAEGGRRHWFPCFLPLAHALKAVSAPASLTSPEGRLTGLDAVMQLETVAGSKEAAAAHLHPHQLCKISPGEHLASQQP